MGSSDQFNIRWNNYTSVLQNVFRKLLEGEQFVDVTLACEGQSIKCHRLILSACSTYFDRILTDNPNSNMVIYLKDMKFWELRALVTFMYNGEVSISQQKLPHLCKAAEALKIKGLANDTGLADGNLDRLDDEEMEDYHHSEPKDSHSHPRENHHHRNSLPNNPKSLLRQHNNLSAFAAAVQSRQSAPSSSTNNASQQQQVKRKILTQPPKLVKMQRMERPQSSVNGGGAGGGVTGKLTMKPQQQQGPSSSFSTQKLSILKREEPEVSRSGSAVKGHAEEEEDDNEVNADSSVRDEVEGDGEEEMDDMEGAEENDSMGSDGDDSQNGQAGRANKVATMKYGKEVRDSAITALQSGMTLRQCSETYGIPKKTLSKWKQREMIGEENNSAPVPVSRAPLISTSGVLLPPKTTMGAPVDSADRAERLKKATELALSGVTVRQAAAHFEIPRTTLCAYMKRRGLAAKRNFMPTNNGQANSSGGGGGGGNKRTSPTKSDGSAESNGQGQTAASHYEDFPFLGISELMDEMGQGNYDGNEEYVDGEEDYTDK